MTFQEEQKYEHLWYLIDAWRTAPTPEETAVAVGKIESHLEGLEIFYKERLLGEIQIYIEKMKPILWDDDANKHNRNIARYNTLDEVLVFLRSISD